MLYIKDQEGKYRPATDKDIFAQAARLGGNRLRRGRKITGSDDVKNVIGYKLQKPYEVFCCLFLDNQLRILCFQEMFRGTINKAIVYPREIVTEALRVNAAAIIFAHNHPSGDPDPSANDVAITEKIKKILDIIEVKVLDHLVVGDTRIVSMADEGLLT